MEHATGAFLLALPSTDYRESHAIYTRKQFNQQEQIKPTLSRKWQTKHQVLAALSPELLLQSFVEG